MCKLKSRHLSTFLHFIFFIYLKYAKILIRHILDIGGKYEGFKNTWRKRT